MIYDIVVSNRTTIRLSVSENATFRAVRFCKVRERCLDAALKAALQSGLVEATPVSWESGRAVVQIAGVTSRAR